MIVKTKGMDAKQRIRSIPREGGTEHQTRPYMESGLRHRNRGGLMTMDPQPINASMVRASMVRCEVKSDCVHKTRPMGAMAFGPVSPLRRPK